MSFRWILILILALAVAALSVTLYLKHRNRTGHVGATYKPSGNSDVDKLLARLQEYVALYQTSTCKVIRPAWVGIKPSLQTFVTNNPLGLDLSAVSCSTQKALMVQQMKAAMESWDLLGVKLDAVAVTQLQTALTTLLTEAMNLTCVNDKLDVAKALTLVDDVVKAFCPT